MPHERDKIVTSSVVYEAAHSILGRSTLEGSGSVLRFLTDLLRAASEDTARALAARELLRRSGCLQDMLDLFLGTETMEHESLKYLCECLVESCKGCENNQNYCNRLIPACLKKWDDGHNNEKLKLLQCLLLKNTPNINLFVECNGIATVFTRDTIHDTSSMELLSIVVQNSTAANLLQSDTDLVKFLFTVEENHKVDHQGSLKMVEWASVILFHIASHIERADISGQKSYIMEIENEMKNTESSKSDISVTFLFKPNWDKIQPTSISNKNKTGNIISDAPYNWRGEDLLKPNLNIETETPKSRFNNYKKPTNFYHAELKNNVRLGGQKALKQKFGINKKYSKGIIKKLKIGMNLYGCNFKKIAQAMWSQEKQMTAQVLYSIYRKFIVK